jgi:hypothetical protein
VDESEVGGHVDNFGMDFDNDFEDDSFEEKEHTQTHDNGNTNSTGLTDLEEDILDNDILL